jgi:hypothetical protein
MVRKVDYAYQRCVINIDPTGASTLKSRQNVLPECDPAWARRSTPISAANRIGNDTVLPRQLTQVGSLISPGISVAVAAIHLLPLAMSPTSSRLKGNYGGM